VSQAECRVSKKRAVGPRETADRTPLPVTR
jgi:hypothetical protein